MSAILHSTEGSALYMAVIDCPHSIEEKKIVLRFDPSKPGHNALNQLGARLEACAAERAPIDMVLHCPKCGLQHIDAPEATDRYLGRSDPPAAWSMPPWKNEPHRSHLCHGCGHIWRPADVPTNGVEAVRTKGKNDSPLATPPAPNQGEAS